MTLLFIKSEITTEWNMTISINRTKNVEISLLGLKNVPLSPNDLGFPQNDPTCIYIDNLAALYMINEKRPTPRAKHIDTQWFAMQEWAANKDIIMKHLSGVLNSSDDLTKPLTWVLHERHSLRNMGHFGRPDPQPDDQDP